MQVFILIISGVDGMKNPDYPLDLIQIVRKFAVPRDVESIKSIGAGHINDTYLVTMKYFGKDFVLQRINHVIFKDVKLLMENILRVTRHINLRHGLNPEVDYLKSPSVIPTVTGEWFFKDVNGYYWRCYDFIPHDSNSRLSAHNAYEGGRAIGKFQELLADLPGERLHETIPFFHDVKNRLEQLDKAVVKDAAGRSDSVKKELKIIADRKEEMMQVRNLIKSGKIPERVTHNDTKFNNILFDENGKAIAIIDLDTVMSSSILFDFGDAIRTLCNTADEDETDLSKVRFNFSCFEQFTGGYLSEAATMLTEAEKKLLAFSCKLMVYIMVVRFITDYLAGDVYFKIKYPTHNFHRAVNQLRLLQSINENFDRMEELVRKKAFISQK